MRCATDKLYQDITLTHRSCGIHHAHSKTFLIIGRRAEDAESFGSTERVYPRWLDVTGYASIPATVAKAEREAGKIDVLVNNAGYGRRILQCDRCVTCCYATMASEGPIVLGHGGMLAEITQ